MPIKISFNHSEYLGISMHKDLPNKIKRPVKHNRILRQYHQSDWAELQNCSSAMPWSKYTKDDPVKAVSLSEKAITKAIEQCVPSKTIQVTSPDKLWFNAACRKATRDRKKTHQKWRLTKSDENRDISIWAQNKSRQARTDYKRNFEVKLKTPL